MAAGPIYVRAPNWVGDLVMATAVLEAVCRRYPGQTTVGVRPHLATLLGGLSCGRSLLPAGRPRSLGALRRELRTLRARRFATALLLPGSFEAGLLAWLARIPRRVGRLEGRSLLMTAGIREPRQRRRFGREPRRVPRYMAELYRDLAARIDVAVPDTHPVLAVLPEEEGCARSLLGRLGISPPTPWFLVNPGASYGASKLWPPEYMAVAAATLARERGWRGIVTSGPSRGEQELAREIARLGGAEWLVPAVGECQAGLGPLKALVRDARLLLTTDSGPRHLAVAFGVPHVVVMGPTDPRFTDRHLERARVVRIPVDCGPCHCRVCPLGHHRCMREIPPDRVLAAAGELLDR